MKENIISIIFVGILLILSSLLSALAGQKKLQNRIIRFPLKISEEHGGARKISFAFSPRGSYKVLYFVDENLAKKAETKEFIHFKLRNPHKKRFLEETIHKFTFKDLNTKEEYSKEYKLIVFDSKHETFLSPEIVEGKLLLRNRLVSNPSGDNQPPLVGYVNWFEKDIIVKALDDKGIKDVRFYVDGKEYSKSSKLEKVSFHDKCYVLKAPKYEKDKKYKIVVTDINENSTERKSQGRGWEL